MDRIINTRSPFYLQFTSAGNEQEATNIIGYSEGFGVWSKNNVSVDNNLTTYAGKTLNSPDGSQTADLISRTSTGASYTGAFPPSRLILPALGFPAERSICNPAALPGALPGPNKVAAL